MCFLHDYQQVIFIVHLRTIVKRLNIVNREEINVNNQRCMLIERIKPA